MGKAENQQINERTHTIPLIVISALEKIVGKKNRECMVGNAVILNKRVRKGLIEKGLYEQRPEEVRKESGRHLSGECYRH